MWGSSLEFREARLLCGINFVFMLFSHLAIQKFAQMISACGAVFFNWLNCQLRQTFNKRKSTFSDSKIYSAYTVYHSWVLRMETRVTVNLLLSSAAFAYENQTTEVKPCRCPNAHLLFGSVFIICIFWVIIYCIYLNKCRLRISAPFEMWKI